MSERTDRHCGVQTIWQGLEAGAVGGAGTWPVRPAAAPAAQAPTAPGKPYRTL